ncbi:muconolactone Delta-isomerase family protein [Streptomyces sp. NPDC002845]
MGGRVPGPTGTVGNAEQVAAGVGEETGGAVPGRWVDEAAPLGLARRGDARPDGCRGRGPDRRCPAGDEVLWGLPLFPYMDITVTPLARHPSAIH